MTAPDTPESPSTWGVAATIKAPVAQIMGFVAHHLDLGADEVHIYLDDDNPAAMQALAAHPRVHVTRTDDAYWSDATGKRPEAHQARQGANFNRAYASAGGVDWLAHIDVDEFLRPAIPLSDQLAALPAACQVARVFPVEALAPDPSQPQDGLIWFKACGRNPAKRKRDVAALYPEYAADIASGFLSHKQGKLFVRTGHADIQLRIHNVTLGEVDNPGLQVLKQCELCHMHAPTWAAFQAHFAYRHANGSYRPGLREFGRKGDDTRNLHQFFTTLKETGGETALKRFFTEVCTATPAHLDALQRLGHLRAVRLDLDAKIARHFPDWRS